MSHLIQKFKSISQYEIVFSLVFSVAVGVGYWGWTFVYELMKPFLKIVGLQYLTAGFWIFVSVFIPYVLRKPGLGLAASLMAAYVQSLFTQWGLTSLLWGLVQGLGAELVFCLFMYKNFHWSVVMLSSAVSAIFSYILDFYMYEYGSFGLNLNLIQVTSFILSSVFIASGLTLYLSKRLLRAGVLNQFEISK